MLLQSRRFEQRQAGENYKEKLYIILEIGSDTHELLFLAESFISICYEEKYWRLFKKQFCLSFSKLAEEQLKVQHNFSVTKMYSKGEN